MNAIARFGSAASPVADLDTDHALPRLHILTCGSVDDGKSTLIGRLLWDATDLYDDQRAALLGGATAGDGKAQPDFSRLLDGLVAEREQGITIDVAWRYFDTRSRRIVVIDSPGHEQYTRNMASGASHADLAILLVDARHGIKRQTRRHAAILDIMGVKRIVLAVNKMDLVGYSASRFGQIVDDFERLLSHFGPKEHTAIPLAAVLGANVAQRCPEMDWYEGPTLLEYLERIPGHTHDTTGSFRMPVQLVLRDGQDFRGLAGTIATGSIELGDEIVEMISGLNARISRISTFDGDLSSATAGQAIVIGLDRDLDIARGAVLAKATGTARAADALDTRLVWLADEPFDFDTQYLLRTATDVVPVERVAISGRLDLATLAVDNQATAACNDIAVASIELGRPAAIERFADSAETGSFLLVDAITGATVAGGVATVVRMSGRRRISTSGRRTPRFVLDGPLLAAGLCADLGTSEMDRREFERRRQEVVRILELAGVAVEPETDDASQTAA